MHPRKWCHACPSLTLPLGSHSHPHLCDMQSGVKGVEPELLQAALSADIVTFGSPSAVKAWVSLVGLEVSGLLGWGGPG